MVRKLRGKVGVLVTALVAAATFIGWRVASGNRNGAAVGRTVEVRLGDVVVKVRENGTLEPVVKVDVKSRVAGRVSRIFVREGDAVKAGEPVATVDPTEVERQVEGIEAQLAAAQASLRQAQESYELGRRQSRLAIRRAEAGLATARARLRQAAAGSRPQEIREAEQAVARAEARRADSRRGLERKETLLDKGFVSQSEVDGARTALEIAEAEAASARERVSLLRAGARPEDVEAARSAAREADIALASARTDAYQDRVRLRDVERARAQVQQVRNQLAQQRVQLAETRIVAPLSGEVVRKYLEAGELIASATAGFAQGAAIVTIADLSRMQVRVNINEVDIGKVRVGLPVEIRVDGIPDAVFRGRVHSIAPSSTTALNAQAQQGGGSDRAAVVRFEVKIAVTDRDGRLRPGMTATVDIIQDRRDGVLLLPQEAVREDRVTVITGTKEKPVKTERRIKVGLRDDASLEVASGLRQGEKVEIPRIDASGRRRIDISGPD
jgi:HlyD family secretion protein